MHQDLTQCMAEWIVKDLVPLSTVESAEFRNFISKLNARYEVPCRQTIQNVTIPKMYAETKIKLMQDIINAWKLMDKTTIGCIGHTLNLAARKALEINSVSQVVGRVKHLVSHFHYSTQSSNLLTAKQALLKLPKRKLIQDVDTHWNSTFDMIQSVLEQQLPISAVLMEGPSKLKDLSLELRQIGLLESLVEVLMPLKEKTV